LYHAVVHAACNMTSLPISSPAVTRLLLTSNPQSLLFQTELLNCTITKNRVSFILIKQAQIS